MTVRLDGRFRRADETLARGSVTLPGSVDQSTAPDGQGLPGTAMVLVRVS